MTKKSISIIVLISLFLIFPYQKVLDANDLKTLPKATEKKSVITAIPILMYHHIRDYDKINDQLGIKLSIKPKVFAAQLDEIIKMGYKTATFDDIKKNSLPDKPIIITFDDGYRNFYEFAYPELKKRKMKAVAFIIAGVLNSPDYMTAEEIKEISDNGIEIGSHTWSHPDLKTLDDKKLKTELTISKARLEELLDKKVVSFAYPYGSHDKKVVSAVQKAGYEYAVTTKLGDGDIQHSLLIHRLRVYLGIDLKKILEEYDKNR